MISSGNTVKGAWKFSTETFFEVTYEEDKVRFDCDNYFNPLAAVFFYFSEISPEYFSGLEEFVA